MLLGVIFTCLEVAAVILAGTGCIIALVAGIAFRRSPEFHGEEISP